MLILGIDPGFAIVGFGLVSSEANRQTLLRYGVITTEAGLPLPKRLLRIERDMTELLDTLRPDCVAIEELFFNTNVTTAINVAQARGVIVATVERCGLPAYEYTPLQVKQTIAGYGRADKKQVMEMTRRLLSLENIPKPDDAADALAIAVCHARSASSLLNGR